jgi:hypothetical protein
MHGAEPALSIAVQPGFPADMDRAAAAASPSHAFLRSAWYAAAGGADKLTLVATRPDGQIVAAIPTVAVGPPLLRMRATPGSYWPIRSVPIAIDASDAELEALLASPQARRALGRAWRLGPVNADDPAASRLVQTARQAGWSVLRRRIATSFRLDIAAARSAGPWPRSSTAQEEPLSRETSGSPWRTAVELPLRCRLDLRLVRQARLHRAGKLGGSGPQGRSEIPRPATARHLAGSGPRPVLADMLHVGLLEVGGVPAAFSFGIEAGDTRYCIATSYDQRFAKHSPGKLLSYRTYVDAADRGIRLLDDGAGDGGHKTVMGEVPGPEILDYLFVRSRLLATLLRRLWR